MERGRAGESRNNDVLRKVIGSIALVVQMEIERNAVVLFDPSRVRHDTDTMTSLAKKNYDLLRSTIRETP